MTIPIFRIFDVSKALEFYVDFLGFRVDWQHRFEEGLPLYMQLSMQDTVIHLSEHYGDAAPGSAVRIPLSNLHSYQEKLADKQYAYCRPGIERAPWGTDEMMVHDPFSNRLTFFEERQRESNAV